MDVVDGVGMALMLTTLSALTLTVLSIPTGVVTL